MNQVKSAYNFVPAPEEHQVFKPSWADQVSHDIPFEDGESGEIEVEITAETPIFIREGISQADADKKLDLNAPFEFSHYFDGNGKKHYFIPATSLKGMTRNVLEIMSFSKLSQIDKSPVFGLRDMNNKTYLINEIRNNKTGWLTFENGVWSIQSCDSDRVTLKSIVDNLKPAKIKKENEDITFTKASAKDKYKSLGIFDFNSLQRYSFDKHVDKTGNIYEIDKNGNFSGFLVLYGSIDNKKYDYIFQEANNNDESYTLEHKNGKCVLLENILNIEKDNPDSLWHYFIKELKLSKIPVFFKEEKGKVKHFGFSKLYRLNNGHSIAELAPNYSTEKDLATTIFGIADENEALKGRVYFSNAVNYEFNGEGRDEERILSTPNQSYYPFYLNQDLKGQYRTYIDSKHTTNDKIKKEITSLKGFKRYPVQTTIKSGDLQKDTMSSKFRPLKEGNQFKVKVRYHNLKKMEIGALISALSFHNTVGLFHSLGAGKPYGFGKIRVEVKNMDLFLEHLFLYEQEMDKFTQSINIGSWLNTKQIKELFSTVKSPSNIIDGLLRYPVLELPNVPAKDSNEFNNYKKQNQSLSSYSNINGNVNVNSVRLKFEEINKKLNQFKKEQTQELRHLAYENLKLNKFDEALDIYRKVIDIYDDGSFNNFEIEVNNQKLKNEIEIAFNFLNEKSTIEELQNFIERFPNSDKKEEIKNRLSKLKAVSGIPENVSNKNNLKQFADNTDNWVKKMKRDGHSIVSLGFFDEHRKLLLTIWEIEKNNSKLSKEWFSDKTKKRFIDWYGITITEEIIKKLK
jgi:CRISPR-associated protein (TIGR03986 family)